MSYFYVWTFLPSTPPFYYNISPQFIYFTFFFHFPNFLLNVAECLRSEMHPTIPTHLATFFLQTILADRSPALAFLFGRCLPHFRPGSSRNRHTDTGNSGTSCRARLAQSTSLQERPCPWRCTHDTREKHWQRPPHMYWQHALPDSSKFRCSSRCIRDALCSCPGRQSMSFPQIWRRKRPQ